MQPVALVCGCHLLNKHWVNYKVPGPCRREFLSDPSVRRCLISRSLRTDYLLVTTVGSLRHLGERERAEGWAVLLLLVRRSRDKLPPGEEQKKERVCNDLCIQELYKVRLN